ncbi:unnamed protein product (macronuclear) [Paramecium tetraurelia]|uniref:Transmembrane protein n=1 Tax=Paramecium tetraurelia TaxID=5888 RepID=A0BHI4_PARTE|nr:uncharacterized protein GSPATT00029036001 [Paramecium tetraurelia]CAK58001.1 unnamed protein product [Paramecium tetraurelia]|eukprot:XP_001425399.1 hypothetical protein (macronuclear) [Paramecium tetraurelia strain d4-2]
MAYLILPIHQQFRVGGNYLPVVGFIYKNQLLFFLLSLVLNQSRDQRRVIVFGIYNYRQNNYGKNGRQNNKWRERNKILVNQRHSWSVNLEENQCQGCKSETCFLIWQDNRCFGNSFQWVQIY